MAGNITEPVTVVPAEASQHVDPRLVSMFVRPEGLVGVHSTFTHVVQPLRPPAENDKEFIFELPHTGAAYIDLKNTQLYVSGSLKRRSGEAMTDNDKVVLTNNALYSLFDSVSIFVGHNQTEMYTGNFQYKSFIKQLMKNDVYSSNLRLQGMDFEFQSNVYKNDYEVGSSRVAWTNKSKKIEFLGQTLIDFCDTDGYLMPACPLRIKYRKCNEAFYVVTDPSVKDVEYNFAIEKIALYTPCVNVVPALTPLLELQTEEVPARYDFNALGMRQYPLPQGTITRKYSRIFENRLPKKILIGFFSQTAFSGARQEAPLLTDPDLDLRRISLSVNGIGIREIMVNYEDDLYTEAYKRFTDWVGATGKDFPVSFPVYKDGYRYYAFDLMENCPDSSCVEEALQTGYIDVDLHFGKATAEHAVMCIFYESPETLEVTRERATRHIAPIV